MSGHESSRPVVFLPSNEIAIERVFPIRNLVGDAEDLPAPAVQQDALIEKGSPGENPPGVPKEKAPTTYAKPPYLKIPPKESFQRLSDNDDSYISSASEGQQRRKTDRSTLVPADPTLAGPPGVLLGTLSRDTKKDTFCRCEDEPIHTPGAIQNYGALLALRFNALGDLEVRIASENARSFLGYALEDLFTLRSFFDILDQESKAEMIARVNHALKQVDISKNEDTHLDVFEVSVMLPPPFQTPKSLWCAIHIANGTDDLIICEFEEYTEVFRLEEQYAKTLPPTPIYTLDMEVHPDELKKSTSRASLPLRVLQIARRKKQRGVSSMDIFNGMTQAQEQLATAKNAQEVMDKVVGIIAELTGFHRVMFYRFDNHKNGCVDAELINTKASGDLFRGLHFPASDIPSQARALYKINRIRILSDRDAETARLICRDQTDFEKPLDLTHSYLRAMSPVHLKYLGNMGVRSSMSISVVIESELWGLIACHGYGDVGIRVTLPIRELCRNIGDCAATNIERLLLLQRILARKPPVATAPPSQPPAGYIAASSADLLRVIGADFGLLSIQDEARPIGRLDPYREALVILAHLQKRRLTTIFASQNINQDFPDIKYSPGIHVLAGLLLIPLSLGGTDFLVFFRKGQLRQIKWAGNPYEKLTRAGSEYLEPRTSFKRWTEMVIGMSKEWTEDQKDTASVLSLLYGKFIEVWRQKEASGSKNRLTRMLIRNSSHEVRTPLNAIVNYLEMALENKLDDPTREILSKAHKASRSLIYVIDDLLNLTKAEEKPVTSITETFDLVATVSEVITAFRKEAMRRNLDLTVSTHQGIPEMVRGDASRLRQVLSNVTSNAFQHSVDGGIKVDIRPILKRDHSSIISITVQDVGVGMSEAQLDDLFQEFEEIVDEDSRLMSDAATPGSSQKVGNPLGVGLAVVARYVRNMKGQIRVRSEPGKGTIFGIELPFENFEPSPDVMSHSSSSDLPAFRFMPDTSSSARTCQNFFKEYEAPVPPDVPAFPTPESQPSVGIPTPNATPGDLPGTSQMEEYPFPRSSSHASLIHREHLSVLIAEDNPVNAKLLTKRLNKLGHRVELAKDGQECHDMFVSKSNDVHAILMDIQMPLVDGISSTKMIRSYEKHVVDLGRGTRDRVPIIAVSTSLLEENRFEYIQSGFDAWILKPIDFGRLDLLLRGVNSPELKQEALYQPGHWEKGGWFLL